VYGIGVFDLVCMMCHQHRWFVLPCLSLQAIVAFSCAAFAQDLLNDNPTYSSFNLALRPYATLPANDNSIVGMTTRAGDSRLYVTTEQGRIYTTNTDTNGNTTAAPWFDVAAAETALGHSINYFTSQTGLQSVAFHPDFDHVGTSGYGKFYTTMLEHPPGSTAGHFYLGDSVRGPSVDADSVLAEWTYDHATGQVVTNSYRELFRVNMPLLDHPIKMAAFNPYAKPGDSDYGLLYVTHGDSNVKESSNDDPQHLDNALGKMIRINPLQSGASRYTIPASNPFAFSNDPAVLKEIYAYGLRNPHTFSFNRDSNNNIDILAGDIGRNNVEEVNLIVGGANYGWPEREGTFVHLQLPDSDPNEGYITGVSALPANEATFGYQFPVAQYDHNAGYSEISTGSAIATGFVIRNGSDPNLNNQLILADFSYRDGLVYHADFDQMLGAVTKLNANDPSRDQLGELTQAVLHKLHLALDQDNNPNTPPHIFDSFLGLLNASRADTRFGEGTLGEMYISSKVNGTIYLVTSSVPLPGDYNHNGVVDAADYLVWRKSWNQTGYQLAADGDGNGVVNMLDYTIWRSHFGQVWLGSGSGSSVGETVGIPEPGTAWMLLIGLATISVSIRRLPRRQFVVLNVIAGLNIEL
jgi:hypothetical protein